MKLPLAFYGDPILRKKCRPVEAITDEIRTLVNNMIETMLAEDGSGIAAPQVHSDLRIFIAHPPIQNPAAKTQEEEWIDGPILVYINPRILEKSDETYVRNEGCLSIPGIYGPVERPLSIRVEAMDLEGNLFQRDLHGFAARNFLHENDHINGVLYIDRIQGKQRQELEPLLRNLKKKLGK